MVLEAIYIVRHGYRMNWTVNPSTGQYMTSTPTPTGIPCDPELASYGVDQSRQLAKHLVTLKPEIDVVYCSPFYRCLQTIKPTIDILLRDEKIVKSVRVDNGIGEFFGAARFEHPSPPTLDTLREHFDFLSPNHQPSIKPPRTGETMEDVHNRNAYALHKIISDVDAEPDNPKAILICTHAASMICIGRALTGHMPEDPNEEDFRCGTCALSKYVRRKSTASGQKEPAVEEWDEKHSDRIPHIDWKNGKGIKGGWDCIWNGDCSFLAGGEERTWNFAMENHAQETTLEGLWADQNAQSVTLSSMPANESHQRLQTLATCVDSGARLDVGHPPTSDSSKAVQVSMEELDDKLPAMQEQAPAA